MCSVPGLLNPMVSTSASAALSWCLQTPRDTEGLSGDQEHPSRNTYHAPSHNLLALSGLAMSVQSVLQREGAGNQRKGTKGDILLSQRVTSCKRNKDDSWVMYQGGFPSCLEGKSQPSCILAKEGCSVLPRAGGCWSCQNKHWCSAERRWEHRG